MKADEAILPKEWVELVKAAMKSEITKDEFRIFLEMEKEKREKTMNVREQII